MRTLVDLPEDDLQALNRLGQRRQISRAKVIRLAVREFLDRHAEAAKDEAFGLWGPGEDGLEYQQRLRSEW